MGRLGVCGRRRHGRLAMESQNELPHPKRHDAHGRRRCVLRRHGRQLLWARRNRRAQAVGPENRRRDRRRRYHLCGERDTKSRRRAPASRRYFGRRRSQPPKCRYWVWNRAQERATSLALLTARGSPRWNSFRRLSRTKSGIIALLSRVPSPALDSCSLRVARVGLACAEVRGRVARLGVAEGASLGRRRVPGDRAGCRGVDRVGGPRHRDHVSWPHLGLDLSCDRPAGNFTASLPAPAVAAMSGRSP